MKGSLVAAGTMSSLSDESEDSEESSLSDTTGPSENHGGLLGMGVGAVVGTGTGGALASNLQ